jgi:hypothetical protein
MDALLRLGRSIALERCCALRYAAMRYAGKRQAMSLRLLQNKPIIVADGLPMWLGSG